MTRAKKLLLLTVAFVLVSQAPFAYRRYKLGRLSAAIQAVSSERRASETQGGYVEYRGVIHDRLTALVFISPLYEQLTEWGASG